MHAINSSTDSPVKHNSPFQDFAGYWFLLNAAIDIYFKNVNRFHKNLIFATNTSDMNKL